jgi:hypothetical protein
VAVGGPPDLQQAPIEQAVTILIDADTVTVIHHDSGEVLSEHTIDPDRSYWHNQPNNLADGQSQYER